jgi:hypothetical protein
VAEGARLESVYTGNRIVGSNPTPSARDPFPLFRRSPARRAKVRLSLYLPVSLRSGFARISKVW